MTRGYPVRKVLIEGGMGRMSRSETMVDQSTMGSESWTMIERHEIRAYLGNNTYWIQGRSHWDFKSAQTALS